MTDESRNGEWDVLVVGGGLGGVAAAVAAARAGARTLLLERNCFLGGVATAGMCCSVFNCLFTGEPDRRLGSFGLALEITEALAESAGYGRKWRAHKGHIIFDIEEGKQVLARMVDSAGASVWLGATMTDAIVEKGRVCGVVVHTKNGPESIRAGAVVDATGDADVAALAGAPLHCWERSIHSLCFRLGNVDVDAFVDFFRQKPEQYPEYMDVGMDAAEAVAQYDDCGVFLFPHGGGMVMDAFTQAKADGALPAQIGVHDTTDACQMHVLRRTGVAHVVTGFARFDGLDGRQISQAVHDGREMAFIVADVYRKYIPGFSNAYVAGTAANLGVRTSRYLDGEFVFTREMLEPGAEQPDAVGRLVGSQTPLLNPKAAKIKGGFRCQMLHHSASDLPYRCLLPRGVEGLVMGAGRSVSSDNPSLLRVMVHTMVVGQAAGCAAAIASGESLQNLAVESVQAELQSQGAFEETA